MLRKKAIFQAKGNIHVVFISEGNVLIGDRTLVREKLNKIGLSAFKGAVPSQGNNRRHLFCNVSMMTNIQMEDG